MKVLIIPIAVLLALLFRPKDADAAPGDDAPGPDPEPEPEPDPEGPTLDPRNIARPRPEPPAPPTGGDGIAPPHRDPGADPGDLIGSEPDASWTLYPVRRGDRFLGTSSTRSIVWRALRSAAARAAKAAGLPASVADSIANDAQARIDYLDAIQELWWNDVMWATWGYGGEARPSGHGRAIRLIPTHVDVAAQIRARRTPERTIALGDPGRAGRGDARGDGRSFELLLLPGLDPDALLRGEIVVRGQVPRELDDLGVIVPAGTRLRRWGHGALAREFEP